MKFYPKIARIEENESIFLDVVRFITAQMVFFGHLFSFLHGDDVLIGGVIPIQNLGVVIFFILSGYLICRTLPKYTSFKDFFIDRFARIYLTLIPCLAIIALMDFYARGTGRYAYEGAYDVKTLIGNLFMLQDHPVLQVAKRALGLGEPLLTSFGSARPLWTLAVEWWLYMFVGYLFLAKRPSAFPVLALAVVPVVFATIGRGQGLTIFWMLGAAMIYLSALEIARRTVVLAAAGFLVLYVARFAVSKDFYDMQANIFLAGIFGSLLIWSRGTTFFSSFPDLLKSSVRIMAGASFALYILHYTVIDLLLSLGTMKPLVGVIAFAISNALAVLVYLVFDKNHKKFGILLRRAFFKPALDGASARR